MLVLEANVEDRCMTEPAITINGSNLTSAQAMAVRAAVTHLLAEMADPMALGDDAHGRAMTVAYRERLAEVLFKLRSTDPASDKGATP